MRVEPRAFAPSTHSRTLWAVGAPGPTPSPVRLGSIFRRQKRHQPPSRYLPIYRVFQRKRRESLSRAAHLVPALAFPAVFRFDARARSPRSSVASFARIASRTHSTADISRHSATARIRSGQDGRMLTDIFAVSLAMLSPRRM